MIACMHVANHPIAASVLSLLQATPSPTGGTGTAAAGQTGGGVRDDEIELQPVAVLQTVTSRTVASSYLNLERDSSPHRTIGSGRATP